MSAMSRASPPVMRSASVRSVASIARSASSRVMPPTCSTVLTNLDVARPRPIYQQA
jgi:hypothetical protein